MMRRRVELRVGGMFFDIIGGRDVMVKVSQRIDGDVVPVMQHSIPVGASGVSLEIPGMYVGPFVIEVEQLGDPLDDIAYGIMDEPYASDVVVATVPDSATGLLSSEIRTSALVTTETAAAVVTNSGILSVAGTTKR